MQPVPRIFVSATSRDLRTARGLVSEGLRRMECLPIVQDDFPPDYKSVRDMLRTKIQTCNAVVHLAGFYYGAEPQPVIPGSDRRSFTQMEYEIAMELKLPCYVFLCGKDFPFDKHDPEPEEKQALQMAHRDRLLKRDELFYEFATPEELSNRTRELQLSVEGLRGELAKERFRRRMTLAACIVLFLVGGGYFFKRMQKSDVVIAETTAQLQKQGDLIAQLLAEQQRLRETLSGNTAAEIVKQAEVNVAKTNKQSVEEVRLATQQALVEAKAAVAAAGNDKTKLIAALNRLIDAESALGHENEAVAAMQQLQGALDRELYPVEWATNTQRLLFSLIQRNPRYDEQIQQLKEAFQWARTSPKLGEEHPATLRLMRILAPALPFEERLAMERTLVRVAENVQGPSTDETLELTRNLARTLGNAAKEKKNQAFADEADQLYQKVIAAYAKRDGPASMSVANMITARCKFLTDQGKDAEAEKELKRLIADIEQSGGGLMDRVLRTPLYSLANLNERQNDFASAIAIRRRQMSISEEVFGLDSNLYLADKNNLAITLNSSGDKKLLYEGEKLLREVLEIQVRLLGASQPSTWVTYANLAACLRMKGDVKGSIAMNLRRLDEMGKVLGQDDIGFASELDKIGNFLTSQEDEESQRAGLQMLQQALGIRDRKLPKDSADISINLSDIRTSLLKLKDYAQAEPIVRREIEVREKYHTKYSKDLENACFDMFVIMKESKRDEEALAYIRKALEYAPNNQKYQSLVKSYTAANKAPSTPSTPPAAKEQPPSLETYANFRIGINKKVNEGKLMTTTMNLPAEAGRKHTIKGAWNGDEMEQAYESNAQDDTNGTFTFYYFNQHGALMSIYRVREGVDVPVKDVKKATDAFNYFERKLVGWKRTQDAAEKVEDPGSDGFAKKGQEAYDAAQATVSALLKAGPKQK